MEGVTVNTEKQAQLARIDHDLMIAFAKKWHTIQHNVISAQFVSCNACKLTCNIMYIASLYSAQRRL